MKPEDLLLGAQDDTNIMDLLWQIQTEYGLDHVAYAGSNPVSGRVFGKMTYSKEWQEHYLSNGYFRIDPTLHEARRSIAPVDWSRLEPSENFQKVFKDAHDFGIGKQGLTVPVHGPLGDTGGLSVVSSLPADEWEKLRHTIIKDLQAYAVHIHDKIVQSDTPLNTILHTPLSRREVEILQWIAAGRSQQDIADILSISHRTVEVHLRSARTKLNALTTAQAVGRAISVGLIHPE